MAIGIVILLFAVINYVNLTAAQTGFRAKEMATRRLLGATKGEVVLKLILESTLMCCTAFAVAFLLAEAAEPYAARLLGAKIDISAAATPSGSHGTHCSCSRWASFRASCRRRW